MRISGRLIWALYFVVAGACVDPVTIETGTNSAHVVVEGWFTNNAEYNVVRLSSSAPFSNNYPLVAFNEPISGANVFVTDESGSVIPFTEVRTGEYRTSQAGTQGQKYRLDVILPDGRTYRSDFSEMMSDLPAGEMTFDVDQRTTVVANPTGGYSNVTRYYFDVKTSIVDPADERNYYLWKIRGVFEYTTFPVGDAPCAYCFCWAELNTLSNTVNVMSDEYVNGSLFERKIASVAYDRDSDFLVDVRQFSIDPNAYTYWNRVSEQQSGVGSIFDPMPGSISGNVKSTINDNEKVLGFFTAASIGRTTLLIKRAEEARSRGIVESNLIPATTGDCRQLYPNSTHIKPIEFYD